MTDTDITRTHPSARPRLARLFGGPPPVPDVVDELAATSAATPVVDADPLAPSQSARLERQLSQVVNHILWSGTVELDANGQWSSETSRLHFRMPYAAVQVRNVGNFLVTLTNSPAAESVPTSGPGVHLVSARTAPTIGLVGTTATLYGTAGERVSLVFYARPQQPTSGEA